MSKATGFTCVGECQARVSVFAHVALVTHVHAAWDGVPPWPAGPRLPVPVLALSQSRRCLCQVWFFLQGR